jgi:prevent-host-death family protein
MSGRVWSVAEAKAKFSDVMARTISEGPQRIQRNGKAAAVLVSAEEWERLRPDQTLGEFLTDPAHRVLTREDIDTYFTRDPSPARPVPDLG